MTDDFTFFVCMCLSGDVHLRKYMQKKKEENA